MVGHDRENNKNHPLCPPGSPLGGDGATELIHPDHRAAHRAAARERIRAIISEGLRQGRDRQLIFSEVSRLDYSLGRPCSTAELVGWTFWSGTTGDLCDLDAEQAHRHADQCSTERSVNQWWQLSRDEQEHQRRGEEIAAWLEHHAEQLRPVLLRILAGDLGAMFAMAMDSQEGGDGHA